MSSGRTGHATYYLDLALVSQNQAGNYSTLNVHYYAIADSGWSGFSNTPIGWSTSVGANGTTTFNGTVIQWANFNVNIGHDANGYSSGTISASSAATGTTTFGGPILLSQGFTLPRIPKVPSAPSIGVAISGRNATITVGPSADNGGSAISNYVTQYAFNGGGWIGTMNGSTGARTYVGLAPGTYQFRAYAVNGVGNGYTANSGTFLVKSGGKVRVSGTWHPATTKVRSAGTWRDGTIKVRSAGTWKDPN